MTWLHIPEDCLPSRYVQESRASTLDSNWQYRGQKPSCTWRGKYTQRRYWYAVWRKESSVRLLYGTTLKPSTAARGVEKWIASLEDIPAKVSPSPEKCSARKTHDTSGRTSPASSTGAAPSSAFSRTSPGIYVWASRRSMMTFKDWVIELRAACSRRRRLVRRMAGSASSFSRWKTPTSTDYKGSSRPDQRVGQLSAQAEQNWPDSEWPTPDASLITDTEDCEQWLARMNARREQERVKYGTPLGVASRIWPTLVRQSRLVARRGLDYFLQFLPTSKSGVTRFTTPRGLRRLSRKAEKNESLRLNPNFAEWLMGWPIGWTDFGPVVTEWSHFRRHTRFLFCETLLAYERAVKRAAKGTILPRREF